MVQLMSKKNVHLMSNVVFGIFRIQEFFTHIVEVNRPPVKPALFAMWHCNQMAIYGIDHWTENFNIMVSRSRDGEMIARVIELMKFKTIRGSKGKKGAVEASMQMISKLKAGENCAIMVDGPHGPARVAKDGAVKIAKMAGVPIVPLCWYSKNPTWVKFPSWDGLRMPITNTNLVNLYGDPIYVGEDDDVEEVRLKLQSSLEDLDKRIPEAYDEVYKWGLWKKKRSDSSLYRWNP